jgi:phenylacetate-CoA ligase
MSFEDLLHPWLAAYTASPQWVKSLVGRTYAHLPLSLRRGRYHMQYQIEAAQNDREQLRRLSERKLAATLACALSTVPAYRPYRALLGELDRPYDVLAQLPTVSKEQLRANLPEYLSERTPPAARMRVFTGGSTSTPMAFYLQKGVSRTKEYAFMESFHRRAGLEPTELVLALRGRTVPTAKRPGGPHWMYEPIKHQLILSSDHLARQWMPTHIETLRTWKPLHIQAYPSALLPLTLWLRQHPAPDVTERVRSIMLFSETVLDSLLDLLREVFACPVLAHYGHSERVLAAASMPDDDRYFFWPQYGHFELINSGGKPVDQPGVVGEIVGTGFDNIVMPFVRYRTGDMATSSDRGEHERLPGYPFVERIEGRKQEYVVCGDGRLVSVNALGLPKMDALEGVDAIHYEQQRPGHLVMRVATDRPLSSHQRSTLIRTLEDKLQGSCTVEVVEQPALVRTPRGKLRMLVQHLDVEQYLASSQVEATGAG